MSSKKTQFKKGQSGNPKGRPKGKKNADTYAAEFLSEANAQIAVNVDGKREVMSVLRAGIKQLMAKAAGGDLSAIKEVFNRLIAAEAAEAESSPMETRSYNERDREIITYVFENLATETHQAQAPNPRAPEPDPAPQAEPERQAEPEPDDTDDLSE